MQNGENQMLKEKLIEMRKKYIGDSCALFYPHDPLYIVKGKGTYLFDENYNSYLDCINNVATVGHCHPDVVKASNEQKLLLETNSRYLHPKIVELAYKLSSLLPSPLHKFYFLNSGSETTDLALLLSFYHTKATEVIVIDHAYHGHLMSSMALSPYKFNRPGGAGKKDWIHIAPCPDTYRGLYNKDTIVKDRNENHASETEFDYGAAYASEVIRIIDDIHRSGKKLAAFICESMISCGGQIILPPRYLKLIYEAVRKAGGVCIADEIQAGYGRCGEHFWAFELQDVVPDIVTIGKPMGNGHPVAALITTEAISKHYAQSHIEYFNTYGGNPVSCAVALSVLEVMEKENLMANSKKVGNYLMNKLFLLQKRFPNIIGDVRGSGLFIGVELIEDIVTKIPSPSLAEKIIYKFVKNSDVTF
ncbi:unnamed protein product [Gordionus sp. m RMFG-2023]